MADDCDFTNIRSKFCTATPSTNSVPTLSATILAPTPAKPLLYVPVILETVAKSQYLWKSFVAATESTYYLFAASVTETGDPTFITRNVPASRFASIEFEPFVVRNGNPAYDTFTQFVPSYLNISNVANDVNNVSDNPPKLSVPLENVDPLYYNNAGFVGVPVVNGVHCEMLVLELVITPFAAVANHCGTPAALVHNDALFTVASAAIVFVADEYSNRFITIDVNPVPPFVTGSTVDHVGIPAALLVITRDICGARTTIAPVPFPYNIPFATIVCNPVPPFPTNTGEFNDIWDPCTVIPLPPEYPNKPNVILSVPITMSAFLPLD